MTEQNRSPFPDLAQRNANVNGGAIPGRGTSGRSEECKVSVLTLHPNAIKSLVESAKGFI